MKSIWRYLGIGISLLTILAATLLFMGNRHASGEEYTSLEFARLKALAQTWEARIQGLRFTYRDELMRNGLMHIAEFPEDWADFRVKNKFQETALSWNGDLGKPQGFALIDAYGKLRSNWGDTSGCKAALNYLYKSSSTDFILSGGNERSNGYFVLQYSPPTKSIEDEPTGKVLAFFDPADILSLNNDAPKSWLLLANPETPLFVSSPGMGISINSSTWPLLLAEKNGLLPKFEDGTLGFCKLQIPGTNPLLLVSVIKPQNAVSTATIGLLFFLGFGGVVFYGWHIRKSTRNQPLPSERSYADNENYYAYAGSQGNSYQKVLQSLESPLCLVGQDGKLTEINSSAKAFIRFDDEGTPDEDLFVQHEKSKLSFTDFCKKATQNTESVKGIYKIKYRDKVVFRGTLNCTKVPYDTSECLLIEFHEEKFQQDKSKQSEQSKPETISQVSLDELNPYPVIMLNQTGEVQSFNKAALKVCPKLNDCTAFDELLPGLEHEELSSLLEGADGLTFESLFGSSSYSFHIKHQGGEFTLYGYPVSNSKQLEISLEQAEQSFEALCSITPSSVILVDVRSNNIHYINRAAEDLLGYTCDEIRDQSFDLITSEPYDPSSMGAELWAVTSGGTNIHCNVDFELVKMSGNPMLLLVLSTIETPRYSYDDETSTEQIRSVADSVEETSKNIQDILTNAPHVPLGPAIVVAYNPTVRDVARRLLEKTGHPNEVFSSLDDATVWMITHDTRPEVLALDLTDFEDGADWVEDVRLRCGDVPCLGFTGSEDQYLPDNGLNCLLTKPFDLQSLSDALTSLSLSVENLSASSSETVEADLN